MSSRRGSGEGSIYQRHDHPDCPPLVEVTRDDGKIVKERPPHRCRGRWVTSIDLGWSNGARRRKTLYGKTKAEVQDKLKKAMASGAGHRANYTVETWVWYWYKEIAYDTLKKSTRRSHRSKIKTYIVPLLGRHRLDALEPRHVRDMYKRMRMTCPRPDKDGKCRHNPSHGLAEATLRQTHAVLRRALTIAVREVDGINRNVAELVNPPSTQVKKRTPLTVAQAKAVLSAAADDPQVARWYAALYMGMRQGECLGLRWEWVNLDDAVLFVEHTLEVDDVDGTLDDGTPKSETSRRPIPIPTMVLSRLKVQWAQYVERERTAGREPDRHALVWGQESGDPWHPKSDWNRWTALLQKAEVPHTALHAARDTTAKLLEQAGVPDRLAAEILGHADVKVTHGYQLGAELEEKRKALERLSDL